MAGFLKDSFTKSNSVGMDEEQMKKDRSGYTTTVQMVTGGTFEGALADIGAEVGNPYDNDELGEDYTALTYENQGGEKRGRVVPATSEKQRELMAIAEHDPSKVQKKNRGVLKMSHKQLHDFASTKGLSKHHSSPMRHR